VKATDQQLTLAREFFTEHEIAYLLLGAELRRELFLKLLDVLSAERQMRESAETRELDLRNGGPGIE
jgi:hypothetical protein